MKPLHQLRLALHDGRVFRRVLPILLFGLAAASTAASADPVRVLPEGAQSQDRRLGPLANLDGYFPFNPPQSPEAWAKRAEQVRRQILVSAGLWPMPSKTPANAVIHGKIDLDSYTVEKVYFESFPGHFVTGNLYRPKGRTGKLPGVLCPHGHWREGRFYDMGAKEVRWAIVRGQERFEEGGRSCLQARCVQLARMGCIVFHYDMVGYADSQQLQHRSGVRPEMNDPKHWGFFSPQAEARLQTIFGLQTYNSIRALDFLCELPDVDPSRIGVTGASGGGTQTNILCAIDPRPAVAVPAVMVSTAMQGGCPCENGSYLRIGSGNVEFAALFAPKPLGLIAADDWTKEIATKGLPELKQLYTMLGAKDVITAWPLLHFPHNYNYVSRAVMYHWFNKHLRLGLAEPIVEEDFKRLGREELSVWDAAHPAPPGGVDHERSLLRWMTEDAERQVEALRPKDQATLAEYRRIVGGALETMIGRGLPEAKDLAETLAQESSLGPYRMKKFLLRHASFGEEIPVACLVPQTTGGRQIAIWLDPRGKQSLLGSDGRPVATVEALLKSGIEVWGIDLLGQGEFTLDGQPQAKARINVSNTKEPWNAYAGYTFGYNHPLFAQRVHDILTVIGYARSRAEAPQEQKLFLVGLHGAGPWAAAARALAGAAVDAAALDTAGFRFAQLQSIDDPNFLPGGAKYDDLPGMLALSAPGALWLAGEGEAPPPVVRAAYQAAGAEAKLTSFAGPSDRIPTAVVEWLQAQ
jgi:hypothetical protein